MKQANAAAMRGVNRLLEAEDGQGETTSGLTLTKTGVLVAFAAMAWFCAAIYIRFRGPEGEFSGLRGIVTFAVTVPVTIPLNWLTLKIAGLPKTQMITAVSVAASAATILDGVAMSHFPEVYGSDPAVIAAGGAWLLWAIGVGLALALVSSSRAIAGRRERRKG